MHRMHNIYLKSLNDKRMCDKYIQDLFECYIKDYTVEKEKFIIDKMNIYCYNYANKINTDDQSSFSNKAICSSVKSCGVTLK
jgi:formate dehydrogenase maturation protein FdhE